MSRFTGFSPCTTAQIPTRQRILASPNLWNAHCATSATAGRSNILLLVIARPSLPRDGAMPAKLEASGPGVPRFIFSTPSYRRKCAFLGPLTRTRTDFFGLLISGIAGFFSLLIWRLAHRRRSLRFAPQLRSPRSNIKQPPWSRPGSYLLHTKRINVLICSLFTGRDILVGIGAHMNRKGGTSCTNCSYIITASHQPTPVASLRIQVAFGRKVRGCTPFFLPNIL